jgi:DNA-binding transcriptional ArsR family regulator
MLARKEARMCSHIVDELPLAQSTASEHLRILRGAGLVQANENGPRVDYCIVPSALKRLRHCSRPCRKGFHMTHIDVFDPPMCCSTGVTA